MMKQMQPVHPAAMACEFMQRAEMRGKEVEPYTQTFNWLQSILSGEIVPLERAKFDELERKAAKFDELFEKALDLDLEGSEDELEGVE